ncbi:MAG: Holliday junction resolvase RuvX [Planctomycetes bacterium]|jgi:putative Holliday junction resolvase|nr:Holliday junction resolvase RuvX [Planctomycetota bacterium]
MRYLAIDLGGKRTGLAVGDDESGIVSPLTVVEAKRDALRIEAIVKQIAREGAEALVVGWPVNMDGRAGPAAKAAEAFADQLGRATNLPVHLHDERQSSAEADQQMAQSGLTHGQKKARRDALAAATILRGFFESRAAGDGK